MTFKIIQNASSIPAELIESFCLVLLQEVKLHPGDTVDKTMDGVETIIKFV